MLDKFSITLLTCRYSCTHFYYVIFQHAKLLISNSKECFYFHRNEGNIWRYNEGTYIFTKKLMETSNQSSKIIQKQSRLDSINKIGLYPLLTEFLLPNQKLTFTIYLKTKPLFFSKTFLKIQKQNKTKKVPFGYLANAGSWQLPEGFLITFFSAGMGAFSTRLSTRWLIKPKYKK